MAITSSFSGRPFERPVASQASSSSTTPCASKRSRSAARHRALNSAADSMVKRVSCATELISAAGSSVDRSTAPPPGTGTGLLTKVLVLDSSDRAAASAEKSGLTFILFSSLFAAVHHAAFSCMSRDRLETYASDVWRICCSRIRVRR